MIKVARSIPSTPALSRLSASGNTLLRDNFHCRLLGLSLSLLGLFILGGCQNDGGADADVSGALDVPSVEDVASGGVDATTAADAQPTVDAGPTTCEPSCKPWQACDLATPSGPKCVKKTCKTSAECNAKGGPAAGDPEHWCLQGGCVAWECAKDTDCGSGEKCNSKTYRCYAATTGCAYDAQCVDDKVCTDDTCDKDSGKCSHKPVKGCCESNKDCDDGVSCTDDLCKKGSCQFVSKQGCCTSDAQCADSSPCTTDTCKGGACVFTPLKNCCQGSGGCDDGIDATDDSCTKNLCVHKLAGMPTTCKGDADCAGTVCAKGACVGGACSWSQTPGSAACCEKDAQCATDKTCMADTCTGFVCKSSPVKGTGTHVWHRFEETQLKGWKLTKNNSVAWFHTSDLLSYGGKRGLRYGVPGKKTWSGGFPNKGSVRSDSVTVAKTAATLRFQVFFDGEPGAGVHQFGARIVDAAGKTTDVWTKNKNLKGNSAGKWIQADISLAQWAGKTVKIELWFDVAVKFPKEDGYGLIIDELRVLGACK